MATGMDELVKKTGSMTIVDKKKDEEKDKKKDEEKDKKKDEDYWGLQGLNPNTELYRVCRYDEDTEKDIVCQEPGSKRSVNQHINSGSKKPSRFISTTTSINSALKWAYYTKEEPTNVVERPKGPQPIIIIYLSKMNGIKELKMLINLTNEKVREHFVSGATQINRVKSSQEVLFQYRIPKKNLKNETVFHLFKNPAKPSKP